MADGNLVYSTGGHLAYGKGGHLVYKYTYPYTTLTLSTSGTMSMDYWTGDEWLSFSYTPGNLVLSANGLLPPNTQYRKDFTSGSYTIAAVVYIYGSSWSEWLYDILVKLTGTSTYMDHDGDDGNSATNPAYPLTGAYVVHAVTRGNSGRSTKNIVGLSAISASHSDG